MFFSYRDFTSGPDRVLEQIKFGRAHHRVIYFVGKRNNLTIKELLKILQITKQSLSRVLNQLVKEKYIILSTGEDKRTKKLTLSKRGYDLEKKLSNIQINKIYNVIKNLEIGQISDPIIGANNIIFLKVNDKRLTEINDLKKKEFKDKLFIQKKAFLEKLRMA